MEVKMFYVINAFIQVFSEKVLVIVMHTLIYLLEGADVYRLC